MKTTFLAICCILLITACSTTDDDALKISTQVTDLDDFELTEQRNGKSKNCHSMHVLQRQIKDNPRLVHKMEAIEQHTKQYVLAKKGGNGNGNGGGPGGPGGGTDPVPFEGTVDIPVVVHVIYSNSQENISSQQIQSQINVLNNDFNASNNDLSQTPSEFSSDIGDVDINFTLDQVIRVSSNTTQWGTNDAMKFSSNGGSNAVDPANKLNIWVCNIGGGILGYAQFPGGNASTDGVVVGPNFFGTTGYLSAPFDEGRTATHEVGHWLNLRHIWGDGRCNRDDYVSDTPKSDGPNYGCPSYPTVNCNSNDMTMNYMDYVDDACMYMFTNGQVDRMRALFATGGVREDIVTP